MPLGPHLLGRKPSVDLSHQSKYPFEAAAPEQGVEHIIDRPTADVYDQGQTPECVGYSFSKVVNWFNKEAFYAPWLYAECKKIDGSPTEDGTNAKAAATVLFTEGHQRARKLKPYLTPDKKHGIAGYTWAKSHKDVRAIFASEKPQPVLIGMDWYNSWFEPETRGKDHWLQNPQEAGGVVGGHEIGIWGVSDKHQADAFSNTWGKEYPDLVWMPYTVLDYQLSQGADACVLQDLSTR